jgi:CrcB protein
VTCALVAIGAAVGAALRFVTAHLLDARLPWGTLLVNVAGSFLLGLFSGLTLSATTAALLGAGLTGGLTTYSAFAVQTHERGFRLGSAYAVVTICLALAACALGHAVGRA